MTIVRIKRGQALQLTLAFAHADGSAFDLSTVTIWGEVRDPRGALLAQLGLTAGVTMGMAAITVADTTVWPVGLMAADLLILNAGLPTPTESFGIEVRQAITATRPAAPFYDPVTGEGAAGSIMASPPVEAGGGRPVVLPATVTITQLGLSPAVVIEDGYAAAPPSDVPVDVPYAATVALDLAAARNVVITLTGGLTLGNPVAMIPGSSGAVVLMQGGSGGNVLAAAGSSWLFPGGVLPVLSAAAGAIDVLAYRVLSATQILVTPGFGFAG